VPRQHSGHLPQERHRWNASKRRGSFFNPGLERTQVALCLFLQEKVAFHADAISAHGVKKLSPLSCA
jgi:hypothetical protein